MTGDVGSARHGCRYQKLNRPVRRGGTTSPQRAACLTWEAAELPLARERQLMAERENLSGEFER
jgi:hypothetical protein